MNPKHIFSSLWQYRVLIKHMVLREVDEETGIVSVTLVGACGTCPASTQTLKAGIERIMRDRVDGVTEVIAVE